MLRGCEMKLKVTFAFCLLSAALYAQDFRATLTGLVTDPSGSAVPNATVKATNVETNTSKEVKTTSLGNYTIPYLDPGNYKLEVTAAGFQSLIRENIVLRVADKLNLPLQLSVGLATQSITVVEAQSTVETGDAS